VSTPKILARFELPSERLTEGTIAVMAKAAREASLDPRIRARARQLFAHLDSMDTAGEIRAVWDFILGAIRYQRDPLLAEHVTHPVRLDQEIDEDQAAEDCEGVETYAAALFAAAGITSLFDTQGRDPSRPLKFSHCSLLVKDSRSGQWIDFDPVGAWHYGEGRFSLGDTLHKPGEPRQLWDLNGKKVRQPMGLVNADTLEGAFSDCGCGRGDAGLGDAGDTAFSIINQVGNAAPAFGPYGQIVGGILHLGTGIYNAATGKQIGVGLPQPIPVPAPPPLPREFQEVTNFQRYGQRGGVVVPPPPPGPGLQQAQQPAKSSSADTAIKVAGGGALLYLLSKVL